MVAHTESQDSLVDPESRGEEDEVRGLLVDWLEEGGEDGFSRGKVRPVTKGEKRLGSRKSLPDRPDSQAT